jgi:hypothetical protein
VPLRVQLRPPAGMFVWIGAIGLSPAIFAGCFLAGAAAVALWLDACFPRFAPKTFSRTVLHVGGTILAAQLLTPLAAHFLDGSQIAVYVSIFVVGFPALVYTLLVAIWIIRLLHGLARGVFR